MQKPEKTPVKKMDKKRIYREETILKAAKRLFVSRGYLKTTMDEVASEADITKPTVYQYFKNKEDLYFSITEPIFSRFIHDMKEMVKKLDNGEYTSGDQIIKDHFATHIRILESDPDGFRVYTVFNQTGAIFEMGESVSSRVSSMVGERYRGMRTLYTRAIEKGLIKEVNVYHLVEMIWGCFLGIFQSLDMKQTTGGLHKEFSSSIAFARDCIINAVCL